MHLLRVETGWNIRTIIHHNNKYMQLQSKHCTGTYRSLDLCPSLLTPRSVHVVKYLPLSLTLPFPLRLSSITSIVASPDLVFPVAHWQDIFFTWRCSQFTPSLQGHYTNWGWLWSWCRYITIAIIIMYTYFCLKWNSYILMHALILILNHAWQVNLLTSVVHIVNANSMNANADTPANIMWSFISNIEPIYLRSKLSQFCGLIYRSLS